MFLNNFFNKEGETVQKEQQQKLIESFEQLSDVLPYLIDDVTLNKLSTTYFFVVRSWICDALDYYATCRELRERWQLYKRFATLHNIQANVTDCALLSLRGEDKIDMCGHGFSLIALSKESGGSIVRLEQHVRKCCTCKRAIDHFRCEDIIDMLHSFVYRSPDVINPLIAAQEIGFSFLRSSGEFDAGRVFRRQRSLQRGRRVLPGWAVTRFASWWMRSRQVLRWAAN